MLLNLKIKKFKIKDSLCVQAQQNIRYWDLITIINIKGKGESRNECNEKIFW